MTFLAQSIVAFAEDNRFTNGAFESGLDGWTEMRAADGRTVKRRGQWRAADDGRTGNAAQIVVDPADPEWPFLARGAAVTPGETLLLSFWASGDPGTAVTALVHFDVGEAPTLWRPVEAGMGWAAQERLIRIPEGATKLSVYFQPSRPGTVRVDDVHLAAHPPLEWQSASTEHFTFRWLAEAPITDADRAEVETRLAWTSAQLGIPFEGPPVGFTRYPDNRTKGMCTGDAGNAHWASDGIHTLFPTDKHEMVHMLAAKLGPYRFLLGEGLAVHLSEEWWGEPVDVWVRRFQAEGSMPDLASLAAWRDIPEVVSYPAAGSFVGWLVRTWGMDRFEAVYATPGELVPILEAAWGAPLAEIEAAWLASVAE